MRNNDLSNSARCIFMAALLAAGMPASAASVETDYDTAADFGNFTSYRWQEQKDNVDAAFATLGSGNIQDALAANLDRQMNPASADHPASVLVRYYIREVKKVVDDRPRVGIGMGGINNSVGGGFSFSFPLGGDNLDKQANVIIDFLDPKTEKLVWRGSTVTGLSSSSPEINQRQIQKAAQEILKRFPPR